MHGLDQGTYIAAFGSCARNAVLGGPSVPGRL